MIETIIRHHNHNEFRITGWTEDISRLEFSQGNDDVRNMQWMVKEVIHNNNNEFPKTKLQSGITILAVIYVSYHPTYQYVTSTWIIKIQNNDREITGDNVVSGDTN